MRRRMDVGERAAPSTPPREHVLADADGSPLPTPPRVSHVYAAGDHEPATPTARPSEQDGARAYATPKTSLTARNLRSSATAHSGQRSVGMGLRKLRASARSGSVHVPARRVLRYQDDEEADHETDAAHDPREEQPHAPDPGVLPGGRSVSAPSTMPPSESPARAQEAAPHAAPRPASPPPPPPLPCTEKPKHDARVVRAPLAEVHNGAPREPPATRAHAPHAKQPTADGACVDGHAAPPVEEPYDSLQQMLAEAERQGRAQYTPPVRAGQKMMAKETTVGPSIPDAVSWMPLS